MRISLGASLGNHWVKGPDPCLIPAEDQPSVNYVRLPGRRGTGSVHSAVHTYVRLMYAAWRWPYILTLWQGIMRILRRNRPRLIPMKREDQGKDQTKDQPDSSTILYS